MHLNQGECLEQLHWRAPKDGVAMVINQEQRQDQGERSVGGTAPDVARLNHRWESLEGLVSKYILTL